MRMMSNLRAIYGWRDEYRRGRSIILMSGLLTAVYNALTSGIFYTGFLSMYGIDLVGVGIIGFIPPVSSCFAIFSPMIVERIARRKPVLLSVKVFQYALTIVATTLMPNFVPDQQGRVLWFCVLQFVSGVTAALFSAGGTPWWSNFLPADNQSRAQFFSYNQMFSTITGSIVPLATGFLTSAIASAQARSELILLMRYIGFGLVLLDVTIQAFAREYPYPKQADKPRLTDSLLIPLKNRKFVCCMMAIALHQLIGSLCSDTWDYYILNDVGLSYARINVVVSLNTPIQLLLLPVWKRIIVRLSWVRTLGLAMLLLVPGQMMMALLTAQTAWLWTPARIWQLIVYTGVSLATANILYLHLPRENMPAYITFNTLLTLAATLVGKLLGLMIFTRVEPLNLRFLGLPFGGAQCAEALHCVSQLALGLTLFLLWRRLTPESELEAIDASVKRYPHQTMGIKGDDA